MFFRITMFYKIYVLIQRDSVDVQADKIGIVALSLFLCTYIYEIMSLTHGHL
jgi:hypothetical protein